MSSHLYRRNGGIRTRDPLLPKQVRYQAAPHSVFSLLCCRFTLWASDHLCSALFCFHSKDSGPKSKPDAVSHWKGDFQWVRYLSICPDCPVRGSERGVMWGCCLVDDTSHTNASWRKCRLSECDPVRDPRSRQPMHPLDQSGRSEVLIIQHCSVAWWSPRWDSNPHARSEHLILSQACLPVSPQGVVVSAARMVSICTSVHYLPRYICDVQGYTQTYAGEAM